MAESGLLRFGSHTRTHTRLNEKISSDMLMEEVIVSKNDLETNTDQKVRLFCYPNGEFTNAAIDVVRQNYEGAVSTLGGWNTSQSDHYLMQRIGLHDDISSDRTAFLSRIGGLG